MRLRNWIAGDWTLFWGGRGGCRIGIGHGANLWVNQSQKKKHHENSTPVNMLFSCSCMSKVSCSNMRERGKAKTKGEKKLSSAGRQPAVEGTHRKWQNKHENIHEDHRTHSIKQKNQKQKHTEDRKEEIGTPSPPPG